MTWWAWLLLVTVLVLGSAAVLALLGLRLWRQVKALSGELAVASDRFSQVSAQIADIQARQEQGSAASDGVGLRPARQQQRPR